MPPRQQRATSYGAIVLEGDDAHGAEPDLFETQPTVSLADASNTSANNKNEFTSALKHLLSITTCQKA